VIGLDYGSRTVGVSVTDALGITVQPLETITRKEENKLRRTCARVEQIIKELGVTEIVVGLPLHLNGEESASSAKAQAFGEMLHRRTGLDVHYQDERLTTVEADEILEETGVQAKDRKTYIDAVAASLILEDFLAARARREKKDPQESSDAYPGEVG
jgi:putative Holliday junction resolvase